MLEPRGILRPLTAEDLLEVRGGMPPYVPDCAICCPREVGDVAQNPETPPNKLDFNSMIG